MDYEQLEASQLEFASEMLRAMAHPVRIAILNVLDKNQKLSVTKIYEKLELDQAQTSHHLSILKNKGILGSKRDGKNIYYFIKNENLTGLLECLNKCAGCPT
jgi:DNA-binding transcriptional ArsR family regulator